eukprot:1293654-Rhodomonas_salina.1
MVLSSVWRCRKSSAHTAKSNATWRSLNLPTVCTRTVVSCFLLCGNARASLTKHPTQDTTASSWLGSSRASASHTPAPPQAFTHPPRHSQCNHQLDGG